MFILAGLIDAAFLRSCGYHTVDLSPCADGRLQGLLPFVLRMAPNDAVTVKAYAGALFDVEADVADWTRRELERLSGGLVGAESCNYLKIAVYHYSSSNPCHQGCAAHGSQDHLATTAATAKLDELRAAVDNSFGRGAAPETLLIGMDTDTDAIRVRLPDEQSANCPLRYVESATLFRDTLEGEHFVLMTSFNSVGFDTEQAARDWAAENKATKGDFNEAKTKATPAAPTSAEQAIRNAFGALPSVTLGEFYPITVTHNGRTQQFLASQRALKRPNQPAPALTLLQIQQGRMIAGAELQDLAYTYKLNGKNELTEESVKSAGDALMKRWSEAFATAPEIEPLLTAPTPEEVVARQDAAEAAQREAEAADRKAAELERQIQLAADSIRELRKVDVDRVLTQDGIDAAALGDYIKRNRPEFAAEVDEVLAEIEQYAESVKAEPAQSPDDFAAQAELERRVQARLRE